MEYSKIFSFASSFAKTAQTGQEFDIQKFVSDVLVNVKTSNLLAVNSEYPIDSKTIIFTSVNSVVQNQNNFTVNATINPILMNDDDTFKNKLENIVRQANRLLAARYKAATEGGVAQFNINAS